MCLLEDTKMLVRDILSDIFLFFMLIVLKGGLRHCLTIPIMCIGRYTSCGITLDGASMCEIISQPSTSGDAETAQNETHNGMYY